MHQRLYHIVAIVQWTTTITASYKLGVRCYMWKVGKRISRSGLTQDIKMVVEYSSVTFHINA